MGEPLLNVSCESLTQHLAMCILDEYGAVSLKCHQKHYRAKLKCICSSALNGRFVPEGPLRPEAS
eukprot:SAG31_NODE_35100_length_326_cov_0.903084_1_plen_64_part_10